MSLARERWEGVLRNTNGKLLMGSLVVLLSLLTVARFSAAVARPETASTKPVIGGTPPTSLTSRSLRSYRGVVQRGMSFFVLLRQAGVSAAEILRLQRTVRPVYNLRHLRVGQPYQIEVTENGHLQHFTYGIDTRRRLEIKRQHQAFVGQIVPTSSAAKQPSIQKTSRRPMPKVTPQPKVFPKPAPAARKTVSSPITRAAPGLPFAGSSRASRRGIIQRGQSSFVLLRQAGVSAAEILRLQRAVRPVYNLRHLRIGRPYKIGVSKEGHLRHFTYDIDAQRRLEVKRQGKIFVAQIKPIVYTYRQRIVQGTIRASLHEVLETQGETSKIAVALADIFAWDIDFHTHLRNGDTFKILIEERYQDGNLIGYHRILAAELVNRQRLFQAVYYAPKDKGVEGDYYRPDGTSVRRMFLRSPLRYTRISSRFSRRRFHPVLKRYRPHLGIDYAAPIGTPVRSVADGTVAWVGRKGENGKMVKIRHNRLYTTYYLHLSRYARRIRVGKRVTQGQVIGYVGSTGLATGPHLDFRITKHGKYLNPLRHKSIQAAPLSRQVLPAFRAYTEQLLAKLEQGTVSLHPAVGSIHARTP